MKNKWKAVFLDIDDTLLDFEGYCRESMKSGFAEFYLKPCTEEMFAEFRRINIALWRQIEEGALDLETLQKIRWKTVFEKLEIDFDGPVFERYFRECLRESALVLPGARELLRRLHGRYILCAASNGPYGQQVHRLEKAGMTAFFDHLFISEELGASKPSGAFFTRAFALLNKGRETPVRPEEAVILGDSLTSDIRGGKSAGMGTVWFNRWHTENTSGILPDHTILTLSEAQKIL